ncbi:hypothetical protein AMAG_13401 [Allomyces macrogynus ATCC 38327]|uniref:Uncharacterized protein n=1 Tax=Allomyces macrogynus (strain ATCC 38327) TaxID=578462 RepID=A0A0L0T1Y3_ALLM3|nr:hypothetical protein AMAG_13401 [Allomyces macrogynus ATCC 38327]|eukprot:KNE68761.1 hypothetical protein AMAG_13401 [Allomyces macrogynus ATCC 38327]
MNPKKQLFYPAFDDVDTALAQLEAAVDRFARSYPATARRLADPSVPTRDFSRVLTAHLRVVLTKPLPDALIIDPNCDSPGDSGDVVATANSDASALAALFALGPRLVETATELQQRLIAIEAHRLARVSSSRFSSPLGRRDEPFAQFSVSSPDQSSLASLAAKVLAMKIDQVVMMLTLISDQLDVATVNLWEPELLLEQSMISAGSLLDLVKASLTFRFAAIGILKGAAQLVTCLDADDIAIFGALTANNSSSIALGLPVYIARVIRDESAVEVVGQVGVSMLDMVKHISEQWQLHDPGLLLALGTRVDQRTAAVAATAATDAAQLGVEQATGIEDKLEALALDHGNPDRMFKSAVQDDDQLTVATPASTPSQAGVPSAVGLTKEQVEAVHSGETRSKVDKFVEGMAPADPVTVLPAISEQIQPRTVSTVLPEATGTIAELETAARALPGRPNTTQGNFPIADWIELGVDEFRLEMLPMNLDEPWTDENVLDLEDVPEAEE